MHLRPPRTADLRWSLLLVLLPAALVLFFGFRAGGYFAGSPAFAAVVLGAALALRMASARAPFAGAGPATLVALLAAGLYAVWVLASAAWSGAASRAEIEFDRALLYLLVIALLGLAPALPRDLRRAAAGVALAIVAICVTGLATRLLPDILPTTSPVRAERLGYPVTYWNALGVLGALGLVLCLHLSASPREGRWVRVAAAAATPALCTTIFFTFSRGAIATGVLAIVAYVVVARPRLLLPALGACVLPSAVAVMAAFDADLLGTPSPPEAAAAAQGHDVLWVVLACTVGAALLRALLWRADARIERLVPSEERRRTFRLAAAGVALAAVVTAIALDAPGKVQAEYRGFVEGDKVNTNDLRSRITEPGNNGRLDLWDAALDGYADAPLAGHGAGTFALLWLRERPDRAQAVNGHSLYLETMAELGTVGLVLVLVLVVCLLVATLRRARGPDRDVYAVVFALVLAWALHAGIDWDWEMPVLTVVPLALGALALARPPGGAEGPLRARTPARWIVGIGCLVLLVTPVSTAVSQGRLNQSVRAFTSGDCATAIDAALAASESAGTRPEPFEVLGFCNGRLGEGELAQAALQSAIRRDPDNWEYHYGLAVVRAADGVDPRAAAQRALELNPHETLTRDAARKLDTDDAARWRAFARSAPLPIR